MNRRAPATYRSWTWLGSNQVLTKTVRSLKGRLGMTRQLDLEQEERQARRSQAIIRAIEFELEGTLASKGAHLHGFSMKIDEYECLLTLRAVIDDVACISWVGADTVGGALIKAVGLGRNDRLKWKEDSFAEQHS